MKDPDLERDHDTFVPVVWSDAVPIRERVTIDGKSTSTLAYYGGHGTVDGEPFDFSMGVRGSIEVTIRDRTFVVEIHDVMEAIMSRLGPPAREKR